MWLLSSSGAEEVSPPLTCPVAFGVSRGFGGKMGATFWKRLLSSAKSLFARANLGDGTLLKGKLGSDDRMFRPTAAPERARNFR